MPKGVHLPHRERVCRHCGKVEVVVASRADRPYCGKACRDAAYAGTEKPLAPGEYYERKKKRLTQKKRENPELNRARARDYYRRHPEKYKQRARERNHMLRSGSKGVVSQEEWSSVEAYYGMCAYCGRSLDLTLDHIEPLSKGGLHVVANIAAACMSCNCSKNDRTLMEWLWANRV